MAADIGRRAIPQRVVDRIWSLVEVRGADECWPFTRSVTPFGYGQTFWRESGEPLRSVHAHRVAWTAANGPIPVGLTVDHLCRNRRCCNPAHLRLLTNEENGRLNAQAVQTHCVNGHPFDAANTYIRREGWRMCRACARDRDRLRAPRRRAS